MRILAGVAKKCIVTSIVVVTNSRPRVTLL